MHRCCIGAAFEIRLAERLASSWPAFLAPICQEAVAHQHRLDARIAQHCVARRSAAVEIGEVVGLEYRSASLDVRVVAVDVLSRDEVIAGFAFWRIRDRRTQIARVESPLPQRPWQ